MHGHTSYAFIADTYSAVLPADARNAAESATQLVLDAVRRAGG
jgi:hypothetical protein